MPNCVVFYGNQLIPKPCIILGPIRLVISSKLKLKVCTSMTSNDSRVISFIVDLKHNVMDSSAYIGWLSSRKEEFLSMMLDSTEVRT